MVLGLVFFGIEEEIVDALAGESAVVREAVIVVVLEVEIVVFLLEAGIVEDVVDQDLHWLVCASDLGIFIFQLSTNLVTQILAMSVYYPSEASHLLASLYAVSKPRFLSIHYHPILLPMGWVVLHQELVWVVELVAASLGSQISDFSKWPLGHIRPFFTFQTPMKNGY